MNLQPGEGAPFEVGQMVLNIDFDQLESAIGLAPNGANAWGIWDNGDGVPMSADSFRVGEPFIVQKIPEPTSAALMGIALLGLTSFRRRS